MSDKERIKTLEKTVEGLDLDLIALMACVKNLLDTCETQHKTFAVMHGTQKLLSERLAAVEKRRGRGLA